MSYRNISVAEDGPIASVTIERPEVRNCVDGATASELADAFRSFDANDDLAVAILTGELPTWLVTGLRETEFAIPAARFALRADRPWLRYRASTGCTGSSRPCSGCTGTASWNST